MLSCPWCSLSYVIFQLGLYFLASYKCCLSNVMKKRVHLQQEFVLSLMLMESKLSLCKILKLELCILQSQKSSFCGSHEPCILNHFDCLICSNLHLYCLIDSFWANQEWGDIFYTAALYKLSRWFLAVGGKKRVATLNNKHVTASMAALVRVLSIPNIEVASCLLLPKYSYNVFSYKCIFIKVEYIKDFNIPYNSWVRVPFC